MKKSYIVLLLLVLLLASCISQRYLVLKGSESRDLEFVVEPDTSIIPIFDSEVLYVLAREYENEHDTMRSMSDYVEDRLIELYPEIAYQGMMAKMAKMTIERLQVVRKSPQYRVNAIDGLTFSTPNESYYNSVSDSAEVELMQMTDTEASIYWQLNALADASTKVRLADFDSIVAFDSEWGLESVLMGDEIPYIVREEWAMSFVSMGMASSLIYRVLQAKARAEYVARHFYGTNTSFGKRGDAYKHIFVNLLLRKYTTTRIAWLVMDVYWERVSTNKPCDNAMDYHNNLIGREYGYEKLVQGSDDWRCWAYNLRYFINDTIQNAEFMNWRLDTPSFTVNEEERLVNPNKYIYWSKDSELLDDIKK